ncbi:PIN-like domain-containing protein [Bacillus paramycoides]|uniref:PIN-like domain-containing protein n=1 Tax=Bacillus paramycoides TaxID=2026194 RepID=UPI002E1E6C8B|nr:PIN domain-containing protein [Bacillus paramycoides]
MNKEGINMHYNFPDDEFQTLWRLNPLIIMDTNVLLELYRYSSSATEQILKVLNSIPSDQIWIPAQVLEEYNNNEEATTSAQYNKYVGVTKEINRILQKAKNDFDGQFSRYSKLDFPLVKELGQKINKAIISIQTESQKYLNEIDTEEKKNRQMLRENTVKVFVNELIQMERVGKPFGISKLLRLFEEGEQRYKYKIPPGYMDIKKDNEDETKRKKFGDLIIWKEILEQARLSQRPIIFITIDEKEDWWVLDKNEYPIKPRDELFVEFREYSKHPLALMHISDFYQKVSLIQQMLDPITYFEMNASLYYMNFIDVKEWPLTLDNQGDLTDYLIQSGNLQDFFAQPISDVEITEFFSPDIEIDSVDIQENYVVMEGSFEAEISIEVTEAYSANYSRESSSSITILGSISFEFEVNFEEDGTLNEEEIVNMDTLNIIVGDFEISNYEMAFNDEDNIVRDVAEYDRCRDCKSPYISYNTKSGEPVCENCISNYEICPDCGFLFEKGSLNGTYCNDCENR